MTIETGSSDVAVARGGRSAVGVTYVSEWPGRPDDPVRRASRPARKIAMTTSTIDRPTAVHGRERSGSGPARPVVPSSDRSRSMPPMVRPTDACSTLAAALRRLAASRSIAPSDVAEADAGAPQEASGADRRALPRRESRASVRIALGRDAGTASDWALRMATSYDVLDLTLSSLAFVSDDPVPASSRLVARLTRHATGDELDVAGRVVRCRPVSNGHHVVVTFDQRIALEQVETFGRSVIASNLV